MVEIGEYGVAVRPLDALQVAQAPSPDHGKLPSLSAAQKNAEISS